MSMPQKTRRARSSWTLVAIVADRPDRGFPVGFLAPRGPGRPRFGHGAPTAAKPPGTQGCRLIDECRRIDGWG